LLFSNSRLSAMHAIGPLLGTQSLVMIGDGFTLHTIALR
jgi:hypothetical protein